MSLSNPSLTDVVKKQYYFKLRAYTGVFSTLVVLQVIAILFSLNGVGMSGMGMDGIFISVKYYSADAVIVFTFIWGFITSILLTTKAYRYDDFSFVTNRLSSNLANILFIVTASVIGGITATLAGFLIKAIMFFVLGRDYIQGINVLENPSEIIVGMTAACLYILLFSALGYFVGTVIQLHRIFVILLPAAFFGFLFLGAYTGNGAVIEQVFEFFFLESSLLLFSFKVLFVVLPLLVGTILISNRSEVRV